MILSGDALEAVAAYAMSPSPEVDRASVDVHVPERTVVESHSYKVVNATETLSMPEHTGATITGRSTHMRDGVTMPGGFVDPGFEGEFALEFFNHSDDDYVIEAGEAAGRLTFMQLSARPDVAARFWSKVDVRHGDKCWEWQKSSKTSGYGQFRYEGTMENAHRVAFTLYAHDPGDMHVLHECDNRSCVNPHHLYLGTNDDNIQDKLDRGRQSTGVDHHNAKLSDEQVKELRSKYNNADFNQSELAEEYGISQSNVSRIVNGQRHVSQEDQ